NGVYTFSVTAPPEYMAIPSTGTVTVNNANVNQQITFTPTTQDSPWLLVVSLLVGATLLALTITAFMMYKKNKGKLFSHAQQKR
ncbi:hypothetical protein MUO71_06885, partial [Candidatus Bathyarchaeota archaeon]|nr:hypothetical protein [Candidatus Bathyarchaeota archaeon]